MVAVSYIRPERLRCRAALQSRAEVADGLGGVTVTWVTSRSVWCAFRPQTGREAQQAMREQSSVTHEIWARYASDITADKRILYHGKLFNIRAVATPDEDRKWLRIFAEEGVAT